MEDIVMEQEQEPVIDVSEPQEDEEGSHWLTIEQKQVLASELEAWRAGGGTDDDFAAAKGRSKSSILRYVAQVSKFEKKQARLAITGGKRKIAAPYKGDKNAKVVEVEGYMERGYTIGGACEKAGITSSQFSYWKALNNEVPWAMKNHGTGVRKVMEAEGQSLFVKVNRLIDGGMGIVAACEKVGMTYARYIYFKKRSGVEAEGGEPARVIKTVAPTEDFNKVLRGRILALEKLVVELSMDKQALLERLEGGI